MKKEIKRNSIFFVLCVLLALLPFAIELGSIPAFAGIGVISAMFGIILIRFEKRVGDPRSRRFLFKLAGWAALGPAFGILHNVPFIQQAWSAIGGTHDEPIFFLLAVLICPALFVLSAAACIGLMVKDHFTHKTATREAT